MEETNRFKGLDLIDRVAEELWMEVRDIIQEAGIKKSRDKALVQREGMTCYLQKRSPHEAHTHT